MEEQPLTLLPSEELFPVIEQLLQAGYDGEFTVTGNSMWPFLAHIRDRVTLRSLGDQPLKRGDIVLFRPKEGKYLLHRVIGLGVVLTPSTT